MILNYKDISFDSDGLVEKPELMLKTLAGDTIGIIPFVSDLRITVKFSEPSEISFTVPRQVNGVPTPFVDDLTGYKMIWTEHLGVYLIYNPSREADGIQDEVHIEGFSIEKELESKRFFLEKGTFSFYNQGSPKDTIIGRLLEVCPGWHVGEISPNLIGRYRTFDEYDSSVLDFVYNDAPEKYRCVFVFDPYKRSINVYDAHEDTNERYDMLPIWLSFDNLLENVEIEEKTDELVTALRPYGADDLDIRNVNPIGSNWIYDLSYFVENGDIQPDALADKYNAWTRQILNRREYYHGLTALRSSTQSKLLTEQAALVDLKGELTDLTNQQSIIVQTIADEITKEGKEAEQKRLDDLNTKIAAKKKEISDKEDKIKELQTDLDDYKAQIQAVVDELAFEKYFTSSEREILSHYIIEQDMTESTFVATDLDTSVSGTTFDFKSGDVSVSGSTLEEIDLPTKYATKMYTIAGGKFKLSYDKEITGDIIRGTLDKKDSGEFILSFYCGSINAGDTTTQSGVITLTGKLSGYKDDVKQVHNPEIYDIVTLEGTEFSFSSTDAQLFLTANASEYQRYSVSMELYDYATKKLKEKATPTYEFSVDSGNFIFAKEFAPFRDKLRLGCGVYLEIADGYVIKPYIIEFELNFDEPDNFSLVFSNRFKRKDNVNTLRDMIEQSYSSSRSFDASKYIYNQTVGQASVVSEFMNGSLDAAKNAILAAGNQSVRIDGAGIHVGGDSKYQMRIIDSMIAMTDDAWQTAKVAIGHFASPDVGEYWGVNADVIGGKLICGNNLVIESENDTGVMQFKVDATGAWLYNASFILVNDGVMPVALALDDDHKEEVYPGSKMMLDPRWGIISGSHELFDVTGTTIKPSFVDEDGQLVLDNDKMPKFANFFLDARDGSAYFRGTLHALDGKIGGFTIKKSYLYSGDGNSRVAMNGGADENGLYAFWAGANDPTAAPFWVMKNGTMSATNATFAGTINASKLAGNLTADPNATLVGCGINVGDGNFVVDQSGNLTLKGDINMEGATSIKWSSTNPPVKYQFAATASGPWHDTMQDGDKYRRDSLNGGKTWGTPYQFLGEDGERGPQGPKGIADYWDVLAKLKDAAKLEKGYITADTAGFPVIYGGKIYGAEIYAGGGADKEEGSQVISLSEDGIEIRGDDRRILLIQYIPSTDAKHHGYDAHIYGGGDGLEISEQYMSINTYRLSLDVYEYVDFHDAEIRNFAGTARYA